MLVLAGAAVLLEGIEGCLLLLLVCRNAHLTRECDVLTYCNETCSVDMDAVEPFIRLWRRRFPTQPVLHGPAVVRVSIGRHHKVNKFLLSQRAYQ
jgi:hypothetical protein